jgi:hypothetical protein
MYVSRPLLHILNASCNSPLVKLHAIHHSGDLLGHAGENSCRHTIHVDMKRLPKDMKCMYIMVLSAFAGALMHNILFPSVNPTYHSLACQTATQTGRDNEAEIERKRWREIERKRDTFHSDSVVS